MPGKRAPPPRRLSRPLTDDEQYQAVALLRFLDDGCSFASSRAFKGGTCAQENGRGFDCASCAARALLAKIDGKEPG
jgi:hypothetical protein